jgi:hypothetical protein
VASTTKAGLNNFVTPSNSRNNAASQLRIRPTQTRFIVTVVIDASILGPSTHSRLGRFKIDTRGERK